MEGNFAIYRLPGDGGRCSIVECGDADVLSCSSFSSIGKDIGFVIAPFCLGEDTPLLVLRCGTPRAADVSELLARAASAGVREDEASPLLVEDKESYMRDFRHFHDKILDGSLRKAVLARSAAVAKTAAVSPLELFCRACTDSPESYVALFRTPASGMWLTATPEILLESNGGRCRTMALAGTRAARVAPAGMPETSSGYLAADSKSWDAKNREEQKIVADYIADRLEPFALNIEKNGPRTVRHGSIEHLRTDFCFSLKSRGVTIGGLLSALHPTPAVCGLPQRDAFRMILDSEHTERQYYSGFSGPLRSESDFRFYVTLRCMKIEDDALRLYAGGGIMADSTAESEWRETRLKMQAMIRCLHPEYKNRQDNV